jgi:hypothetical protein
MPSPHRALQDVVDGIAERLACPVTLEDDTFRLIAYSTHDETADRVRQTSILSREAPPGVADWLHSRGVHRAREPIRVPTNAELGMTSRLCVPLRFDAELVGYLWLLDTAQALAIRTVDPDHAMSDHLAATLARLEEPGIRSAQRQAELMAQLVTGSAQAREAAAVALRDEGLLSAQRVVAMSVRPLDAGEPVTLSTRLAALPQRLRRKVNPGSLVYTVADREVNVLLAADAAARVLASVEDLAGAVLGVGGPRPILEAAGSMVEARAAARVASRIPRYRPAASWDQLGSLGFVARMDELTAEAIPLPPALLRLMKSGNGESMVRTLEVYLDLGGDAKASAEALALHRGSIYQRIRRIQEVAEVDLDDGDQRLLLHLGLRMLRLRHDHG